MVTVGVLLLGARRRAQRLDGGATEHDARARNDGDLAVVQLVPGRGHATTGNNGVTRRHDVGLQRSTLVVLQSTQSGGTLRTLVLGHSVVLVLVYSYSVVLSGTQLKP